MLEQDVMRTSKRIDPPFESFNCFVVGCVAESLSRDGLHQRQGVLEAMAKFVVENSLPLLDVLAFGDVANCSEHADGDAIRVADQHRAAPGPWRQ